MDDLAKSINPLSRKGFFASLCALCVLCGKIWVITKSIDLDKGIGWGYTDAVCHKQIN